MKKICLVLLIVMMVGCATNKEAILKSDWQREYWMPIFQFISHDEENLKFIKKKLHSPDMNEKMNAILLLTKVHLAEDTKDELVGMYWNDTNFEVKRRIITNLHFVTHEIEELDRFCREVKKREKNEDLKKIAELIQKTLPEVRKIRSSINFTQKKEFHDQHFKSTYKTLYSSYGKEGDYRKLALSSTIDDEKDLFELNKRISIRQSDEALDDIFNVTQIIWEIRSIYYNHKEF